MSKLFEGLIKMSGNDVKAINIHVRKSERRLNSWQLVFSCQISLNTRCCPSRGNYYNRVVSLQADTPAINPPRTTVSQWRRCSGISFSKGTLEYFLIENENKYFEHFVNNKIPQCVQRSNKSVILHRNSR